MKILWFVSICPPRSTGLSLKNLYNFVLSAYMYITLVVKIVTLIGGSAMQVLWMPDCRWFLRHSGHQCLVTSTDLKNSASPIVPDECISCLVVGIPDRRRPSGMHFPNDSEDSDEIGDCPGRCFNYCMFICTCCKNPRFIRDRKNPWFLRFLRQVRTRL